MFCLESGSYNNELIISGSWDGTVMRVGAVQYPCSIRAVSVQYPCSIQKHVITYFCAVSYCAFEGTQRCKKLLHMLEQKLQKAAKMQK